MYEELCSLSPAARLRRCHDLLQDDLPAVDRAWVRYHEGSTFYSMDKVTDALCSVEAGVLAPATGLIRAMLQSARANCLYDLWRMTEMAQALTEADDIALPPSPKVAELRAHVAALTALMVNANGGDAFDMLMGACALYEATTNRYGRDWMLVEAAKVAVRVHQPAKAVTCLSQVTHELYAPDARLIEADLQYQNHQTEKAAALIHDVLAGIHGEVKHRHRAYAQYLEARRAFDSGEIVQASVSVTRALNELSQEPRKDPFLLGTISVLRSKLAEKGVA